MNVESIRRESIRLRTWGSQVRVLPGAPLRREIPVLHPRRAVAERSHSGPSDTAQIRPILGRRNDKTRAHARAVLRSDGMDLTPVVPHLRALLAAIDHPNTETVADGIERWHRQHVERRCKPSTAASYRDATRLLLAELGDTTLMAMTTEQVEAALQRVAEGSRSSVFSAWSSALTWLGRGSVMAPLRRPKSRRRDAYLDTDGMRHWIASMGLAKRHRWARNRTIDALLVATLVPMRRGEICSLRWREVDLGLRVACLEDSKTGRRWVPLGRLGASLIASQPRCSEYVFAPPRATPTSHITGSSLAHAFARITRRYATEKGHRWPEGLCFHSLRHSWASHARHAGEAPERVRQICGWSTAWMLDRYSHALSVELGEAMDRAQGRIVTGLPLQLSLGVS
jgi:integrase